MAGEMRAAGPHPGKAKMEPLEIEVKFPVAELASIRKKITETGAISEGRRFEVNVRFDDADQRLRRAECLLRLRKDARTTLTFKSSPDGTDRQFKIHRELEVQVSDFDIMEQILGSLGFERRQVYEKWRETFRLGETLLCLDEMPFGNYLEIEGPKEAIRRTASHLGLDWDQRILKNYLEMFSILQARLQLSFADITFDNFESVTVAGDSDKLFR
jgi:adenylate cyclase class 2